jgi:serine/threonine-protein kinase
MSPPPDPSRDLLFGLLALQVGLIDQAKLVAGFQAWTLEKGTPLADHLVALGHLDPDDRSAVGALVARHLKKHGGDVERSLAAVPAGTSTRERLAALADPALEATLSHVGSASAPTDGDSDRTRTYQVDTVTSDGQRFRVLRPHARGGLGAVFVALDSELNREVALKRILDGHADDPVSRQRFLVEAEITGGLEHPGVVPVYGLGAYADGRPYYAMRFIRGDSLKEAIGRFHADEALTREPGRRSLELRKLLRRFTDVCNAIEYAHSRGVLHRDIKPGNVIVGRHGETLVVDWGLAKATGHAEPATAERTLMPSSASGSSDTLPGQALGTPAYMSPEQARGDLDSLGPRSDVYALGATLYCLLTGKAPFEGDVASVLRQVERGGFRPPRQVDTSIDRALEAVCLKAMATRPGDRYGSARALAEDLERWMADAPVSAWREPFSRRARRWAGRNRTAVTAAGAALLVALAGLSAVLAVQRRANLDLTRVNGDLRESDRAKDEANAALASANARVQRRFDLAAEAIRRYHSGVSEDVLLKQAEFEDLRGRLLRDAAEFYRKLESDLSENDDPASRRSLGGAYAELGDLVGRIGSKDEALAILRRALDVRRALAAASPDDEAARVDVARGHNALAMLLVELGRREEARAAYGETLACLGPAAPGVASAAAMEQAARAEVGLGLEDYGSGRTSRSLDAYGRGLRLREALVRADPDRPAYRDDLAKVHGSIASASIVLGRVGEARAAYDRALGLLEGLAAELPDEPKYRRDLWATCINFANFLGRTGRLPEAIATIDRARGLVEGLVKAQPTATQYRLDRAKTLSLAGYYLAVQGRHEEAKARYGEALDQARALVAEHPGVPMYRSEAANIRKEIGERLSATGKAAEALEAYREARDALDELVRSDPGRTHDRVTLASAEQSIGVAEHRIGHFAEARAALDRAIALDEALAGAEPDVPQHRANLASVLNSLAVLQADTGRGDDALATHERALALREALARDHPTLLAYRAELAITVNNIGAIHLAAARFGPALAAFERSRALRAALVDEEPVAPSYRIDLAGGENNIGAVLYRMGDYEGSAVALDRGRALRQSLVDSHPDVVLYRIDLAGSLNNLGVIQRRLGRDEAAMASYRRAVDLREALVAEQPRAVQLRSELASTHLNLAYLLARLGHPDEALAAAERSLVLREALLEGNPGSGQLRRERATSLVRVGLFRHAVGRRDEGLAEVRRALGLYEAIPDPPADQPFHLACYYAQLSRLAAGPDAVLPAAEGRAAADRALALLRRAVAAGQASPGSLRTDDDLDPLRDREDFRRLLLDAAFPAAPFAP